MTQFIYYCTLVPAILIAITCHEYAHARVALWFGDDTAARQGRVSLNPLAHLDPWGTIMIVLVGFGWGKPVPVDVRRLRHPRANAYVSAAGPLTNFFLAVVASLLFRVYATAIAPSATQEIAFTLIAFCIAIFVQINLALCFFNLIPLFPLDGSHVLGSLLPATLARRVQAMNYRYGAPILLTIVLLGYVTHVPLFSLVLGPPIRFCLGLLLGDIGHVVR
jgi:Zn-dependent protease